MPSVFVSYARDDLDVVQQLAQGLMERGVSVWRDQDSLYAGQKWPKALGEAIASHDAFRFVWSKHSAASEYVELEWCTAVALKKTIFPWLLDETPLPSSIASIQAIDVREPAQAVRDIMNALPAVVSQTDQARSADVIRKLADIPATEPREILRSAKLLFNQQHWTVQGNVIQAAGDTHVTTGTQPAVKQEKSLLEKWQTWVVLVVGILTAITLLIELPEKVERAKPTPAPSAEPEAQVVKQVLAGTVRDEANDPMPGVRVSIPKYDLTTTSDENGVFRFDEVMAPKQELVDIQAWKDGYMTFDDGASLGRTSVPIDMEKKR